MLVIPKPAIPKTSAAHEIGYGHASMMVLYCPLSPANRLQHWFDLRPQRYSARFELLP